MHLNLHLKYLFPTEERREGHLKDVQGVGLFEIAQGATSAYHLFVIKAKDRKELQFLLNEAGVGTLIHYPIPPHMQEAYAGLGMAPGDLPIAESLASSVISLPMGPHVTIEQVEHITSVLGK